MNIITGYRDEPHVTSQQVRDTNIAIYGNGVYILNVGDKLAATVISANEIEISDGLVVAEGCTAEVERGTTESIAVDNGEQGMLRKDLIVLRYTKNASTNVEDMEIDIIKGTSASANPATPSYTSGSIADGDTLVEFPLYAVNLNGITISSVDRLVDYAELASNAALTSLTNTVSTLSSSVATLTPKVNANTSNVADARTRVSALETKTDGFVRVTAFNVSAGANDYKQMNNLATYVLIVNAASTSNTMQGMYLIGCTTNSALGIKAISAASSVTVTDGGSGLLKVTNNGSATLRCTLVRTYG